MELKKVWMSLDTEKKSHYGYRTVGGILGIVFLMTVLLFIGTFLSILEMELKKVWMSLDTEKKSHYGYRTVGGILGIVFLMTVLLFIGTFLSISLGLPQQSYSMVLVLMAAAFGIVMAVRMGQRGMQDAVIFFLTENDRLWIMDARGLSYHGRVLMAAAFGIVMAVRMGQRGMQDAVIFFLTENDRLWIMDARGLSYHGRGFWGFALGAMETQKFLRMQGKSPYLPAGASEILKVWNIKENRSHYAIRCQSRYRKRRSFCVCREKAPIFLRGHPKS